MLPDLVVTVGLALLPSAGLGGFFLLRKNALAIANALEAYGEPVTWLTQDEVDHAPPPLPTPSCRHHGHVEAVLSLELLGCPAELVAFLCTDCGKQLPPDWKCESCLDRELIDQRVLSHAWNMPVKRRAELRARMRAHRQPACHLRHLEA